MADPELRPVMGVLRKAQHQLDEAHEMLRWIVNESRPAPSYVTRLLVDELLKKHGAKPT